MWQCAHDNVQRTTMGEYRYPFLFNCGDPVSVKRSLSNSDCNVLMM